MAKRVLSKSLFAFTRPGGQLFSLIDAAADASWFPAIEKLPAGDRRLLFPGDIGRLLADHGPYLVRLRKGAAAQALIDRTGDPERCLFLWSESQMDALADHFAGLLLADAPGLGRALHFRFYDPAVFASILPHCQRNQLARLFGPVACFRRLEGGAMKRYVLGDSGLSVRRDRLAA